MSKTQVVNIYKDKYDVYIGRSGRGITGEYGNPIPLNQCKDREDCIFQYQTYFTKRMSEDAEFAARIEQLRGQRLGCFCVKQQGPLSNSLCHGMVIVKYLEGKDFQIQLDEYQACLSFPAEDRGLIAFD